MFPVAQRDVVWFYVTPAQRNVYLSVAARACLLNASSSRGDLSQNVELDPSLLEVELRRRQVDRSLYDAQRVEALRELLSASGDVRDRHGAPRARVVGRRLLAQWAGHGKV